MYTLWLVNLKGWLNFQRVTKQIIRNRTKDSVRDTVNWLKIKHFRYLKAEPQKIYFKYDTDMENTTFRTLNVRGRGRPQVMPDTLPNLYSGPVQISSAKYKDLIDLCEAKIIHKDYHPFYLSLRPDNTVQDCLPETDIEDESESIMRILIIDAIAILYKEHKTTRDSLYS